MTGNLISMPLSDISKLIFGFQSFKVGTAAAAGANQQMLMAVRPTENRLALTKMMDAVDQFQFLKFFDRPIDCDQADVWQHRSRLIKDLHGSDWPAAGSDDIKDHTARVSDTVTALAELIFPFFGSFRSEIIHSY